MSNVDTTRDKRTRLIETSMKLAYEQGFHTTSLADIARASGVPLGNVYYYFKTKEELGEALVDRLAEGFAGARASWAAMADPRDRLVAFVQMTADNRESLARSGCPIGTLCTELHKQGGALAERASQIFAASLTWMEEQFRALGQGDASRACAEQLLATLEGASLLTHAFHDIGFISREAARMQSWIRGMA